MMRRALLLSTSALVLASPAHAFMKRTTNSAVASACVSGPFASIDGCAGAGPFNNSTLNFYRPILFSDGSFFQNGQCPSGICAGVAKITWSVPGKNFAVGVRNPTYCDGTAAKPCSTTPGATGLINAWTYPWASNWVARGCDATSSVDVANHRIRCIIGASGTVDLSGFDWTPNEGGAGETCVSLDVSEKAASVGTISGTVNFKDNHWHMLNYPACTAPAGRNYQFAFFNISGTMTTDAWDVNIMNNSLKQDVDQIWVLTSQTSYITGIPAQYAQFAVGTGGKVTYQYNYGEGVTARMIDIYTGTGGADVSYNLAHNMGYYPIYNHFEIALTFPLTPANTPFGPVRNYNNIGWSDFAQTDLPDGTGMLNPGVAGNAAVSYDAQMNITETNLVNHYSHNNTKLSPTGTQTGTTQVGDVYDMNIGGCAVPPRFVVSAIDGSSHIAAAGLTPWMGGNCATNPPVTSYTLTCNATYGKNCSTGGVTGASATPAGLTNIGMGNAIIYSYGSGAVISSIGSMTFKNNAADAVGLNAPWRIHLSGDATNRLTCGSTDYGVAGSTKNWDLITGSEAGILYTPSGAGASGC
jgi:hypothetical protein